MTPPPRVAPGGVVVVAGPNVAYRVDSLETSGPDAVVHLRTVDGLDWSADRPVQVTGSTCVLRRHDEEARRAWVEDPVPESLQAARLGIEHVEHHGRGLRFAGSTYGVQTIHRFACWEPDCPFVLYWSVTE